MSNNTDNTQPIVSEPTADRPATPQEEQAADRAARGVDVDEVGEHFREMTEIGKDVKGEGEITPSPR